VTGGESSEARDIAEAVARRSYGKLLAFLAASMRDVSAAEDALADAFASALAEWPVKGCPANPEAWLMTVARRKIIDAVRRRKTREASAGELLRLAEDVTVTDLAEIPDRRLALMFACAHPDIDASVRAPLIMQTVLGLNANAIASAFLTSPAAMGKRLVRAKERIKESGIAFAVPERAEMPSRLEAVLDAIYAAFSEGWADPGGTDVARRNFSEEAIFLARLVADLLPQEPEALGLLALILYTDARRSARRDAQGEYVPLAEQIPASWDGDMIADAETALRRAGTMQRFGRYQLEAALQSAHVHRCKTGAENWAEIVQLYDALFALTSSPVVAINRAVALAEVEGPQAGLASLQTIASDTRLADYQPYWAARADLLARSSNHAEAHQAYETAIGLERDPAVKRFLRKRQMMLRN